MFFGCYSIDSDISTHQERVLLLLKVRFRIEFFNFVSAVVRLLCEWSWAIRIF
jgi:hypothetical protein